MINGIKDPAFYVGVVEDRDDPLKVGRVRVRVIGLHTYDKVALPTADLPWAYCIQPVHSAGTAGIGQTPVGPVEGTWVTIQFIDQDLQKPFVSGTLQGIASRDVVQLNNEDQSADYQVNADGTVENTWDEYNTETVGKFRYPNTFKTQNEMIEALKGYESFRQLPYLDARGIWTIGYGTTVIDGRKVTRDTPAITEQQATEYMSIDIANGFEPAIQQVITVPITQSMFDAMVSLAYNIGAGAFRSSTVVSELNAMRYASAAEAFMLWVYVNQKVNVGLQNRRQKEKAWFLKDGASKYAIGANGQKNAVDKKSQIQIAINDQQPISPGHILSVSNISDGRQVTTSQLEITTPQQKVLEFGDVSGIVAPIEYTSSLISGELSPFIMPISKEVMNQNILHYVAPGDVASVIGISNNQNDVPASVKTALNSVIQTGTHSYTQSVSGVMNSANSSTPSRNCAGPREIRVFASSTGAKKLTSSLLVSNLSDLAFTKIQSIPYVYTPATKTQKGYDLTTQLNTTWHFRDKTSIESPFQHTLPPRHIGITASGNQFNTVQASNLRMTLSHPDFGFLITGSTTEVSNEFVPSSSEQFVYDANLGAFMIKIPEIAQRPGLSSIRSYKNGEYDYGYFVKLVIRADSFVLSNVNRDAATSSQQPTTIFGTIENPIINMLIPLDLGQSHYCDYEEKANEGIDNEGGPIEPTPNATNPTTLVGRDPFENQGIIVHKPITDKTQLTAIYTKCCRDTTYAPVNANMFGVMVQLSAIVGLQAYKKQNFLIYLNSGDTLSAAVQISNLISSKNKPELNALISNFIDRFLRGGYLDEDGQYCDTPQSIKYIEQQPGYVPRPQFYPNDPIGFQDPAKTYPRNHTKGEPDISRLARNERTRASLVYKKQLAAHRRIQTANRKGVWDQPIIPYNTKYPFNNVTKTESGHVIELDDTPGSERINIAHRSGSFIETDASGTTVRRTVGEDYTIIEKNGKVHIVGNADVNVGGAKTLRVEGAMDVEIHGATNVNVHNSMNVNIADALGVTVGKAMTVMILKEASIIAGGDLKIKSGGNLELTAVQDITISAGKQMNLTAGGTIAADAAAIHLNSGASKPASTLVEDFTPLGKLEPTKVDISKSSPKSRIDDASAIYETPDDGTAQEIQSWKQKRIQEGTATAAELETIPPVRDKAVAASSQSPKQVSTNVPAGREFRSDDKISKYFTLGDMTKGYTRKLVDKLGHTQEDIFKNLCYLAENVLDPIKEKYPNMVINSGFREELTKSQHNIGQAVDISFPDLDRKGMFKRVQELSSLVPYDQMLLEYSNPGGNGWIHISLKPDPRNQTFTMLNHKRIQNFGEFVYVA